MTEQYLSVKEVAEHFNVSTRTINRAIDDGELPGSVKKNPTKRNSPYMIPISAVKRFEKLRESTSK